MDTVVGESFGFKTEIPRGHDLAAPFLVMYDVSMILISSGFGSRVEYADYPGITPDPNHEVRGVYVTGLTSANMYHLDQFEGSEYDRKTVKVRLLSKIGDAKGHGNVEGEEVECEVYVYNKPAGLEDREWDFEEFRTQKMKKWTREDYGFAESDLFSKSVDGDDKEAAVCKWNISFSIRVFCLFLYMPNVVH